MQKTNWINNWQIAFLRQVSRFKTHCTKFFHALSTWISERTIGWQRGKTPELRYYYYRHLILLSVRNISCKGVPVDTKQLRKRSQTFSFSVEMICKEYLCYHVICVWFDHNLWADKHVEQTRYPRNLPAERLVTRISIDSNGTCVPDVPGNINSWIPLNSRNMPPLLFYIKKTQISSWKF